MAVFAAAARPGRASRCSRRCTCRFVLRVDARCAGVIRLLGLGAGTPGRLDGLLALGSQLFGRVRLVGFAAAWLKRLHFRLKIGTGSAGAIKDQRLAQVVHWRARERRADFCEHCFAGIAIGTAGTNFDQLVCSKVDVDFLEHRSGQAVVADEHDRLEGMGGGTQRVALAGGEVQNSHREYCTGMAKKKFSKEWVMQHINDPYVKLAQQKGYRARAAFKLIEILDAEKLMRRGDIVVDLGATPGSWSQVARERLAGPGGIVDGRIVAVDLLPMEPVAGVEFILGDFSEEAVLEQVAQALDGRLVDLVMSDMAPNLSGVSSADSARIQHVCELAMDFAISHLRPEGTLIVKAFHGSGFSQIVETFKKHFRRVVERKPKASRDKSSETFLVARGLKQ